MNPQDELAEVLRAKFIKEAEKTEMIWEAGTGVPQLDDLINEHVGEAIKYLAEGGELIAYFPVAWWPRNGGSEKDAMPHEPLTLHVCADRMGFRCDFDLWTELIETIEAYEDDGSFVEGLARIAPRLRELVDRMDAAVVAGRRVELERSTRNIDPPPATA